MPRRTEGPEAARETTRERIVESALGLFGEHGYAGTSVRAIAEDAGVSQGLLYNYFEGKEALLEAIVRRSMVQVQRSFGRAVSGATPQEKVERLVRAAFETVSHNLPFWRLLYQLRMQPGVLESLGGSVEAWTLAIRLQLAELLREGGVRDVGTQARLLFAAIDGVAQHYAMDPEHYPIEEVTEALIGRFGPDAGRAWQAAPREGRA